MRIMRCSGCDITLQEVPVERGYSANCPRCGSRAVKGTSLTLSGEVALALTALIFFIPAYFYPLITINLFGVLLPTTVTSGAWVLLDSYPFVAMLVLFCVAVAPFVYLCSILAANAALHYHHKKALYLSLSTMKFCRHWVMIDVFLVSLAIAAIKVQELADIHIGTGLYSFVLLQLLVSILLARSNPKHYWNAFAPHLNSVSPDDSLSLIHCQHCGACQCETNSHCVRCTSKLSLRKNQSVQKTWACLLAATIFVFPANLYPISILLTNGKRLEDTIFSGVGGLINEGMTGIAIIIFAASIVVPVAKIVGLAYILCCIQFKRISGRRQRMVMFRAVKWIGKWSVMDLCVIAIMVSLIDRGRILDFTPGPGAIAFAMVVVLTMIAAECLDSRLIWDEYEQ